MTQRRTWCQVFVWFWSKLFCFLSNLSTVRVDICDFQMFCVWCSCFLESLTWNPNKPSVLSGLSPVTDTSAELTGLCIKRAEETICGALRWQRGWRTCLHQLPLKWKGSTMRVASLTDSSIDYVATLKGKFVQKPKKIFSHYLLIHMLMETTDEDGDSILNVQQKNNPGKNINQSEKTL